MKRIFGLMLAAGLAVTGLTACMSDNKSERRSAALVSITGTGGQPFSLDRGNVQIPDGVVFDTDTYTVPAGKLLVIEHVSGLYQLPSGQTPFVSWVRARANGVIATHRLQRYSTTSLSNYFSFSQALTLYADPGSTVTFGAYRNPDTAGVGYYSYALSGYMVDAP